MDLGLNSGEWALAMIGKFGCSVFGVEPVPALFDELPDHERLQARHCAVASQDGPATLFLNDRLDATLRRSIAEVGVSSVEVPARTLPSLLQDFELAHVDLLKADIEGAEVPLFLDTPDDVLLRMRQITVEFHDWLDPSLARGVREGMRRLEGLGFQMLRFSRTNGDVLFVRPPLGITMTWQVAGEKYGRGIARIARRSLFRISGRQ